MGSLAVWAGWLRCRRCRQVHWWWRAGGGGGGGRDRGPGGRFYPGQPRTRRARAANGGDKNARRRCCLTNGRAGSLRPGGGGRGQGPGGRLYLGLHLVRLAGAIAGSGRTREGVRHYIGVASDVSNCRGEFGDERQVPLLAS